MRFPRMTTRRWMMVAAVGGAMMWSELMMRLSRRYRQLAVGCGRMSGRGKGDPENRRSSQEDEG
jgi:hypothetical protein